MAFQKTSRNIRLDGTNLVAECRRIDGSWRPSSLPLDMCLGNINGVFKWGYKAFSHSARDIRIEAAPTLHAAMRKQDGSFVPAEVDLSTNIVNADGVLKAINLPAVIAIPQEGERAVLEQLGNALEKNSDMKVSIVEEKEGSTLWCASTGAKLESSTFFTTFTDDVKELVVKTVQSKGHSIEKADTRVLSNKEMFTESDTTDGTGSAFPVWIAREASLNMLEAGAGIDLGQGIGVATSVSLKDGSLGGQMNFCGIQVGGHISISPFGPNFGIDFGGFFG